MKALEIIKELAVGSGALVEPTTPSAPCPMASVEGSAEASRLAVPRPISDLETPLPGGDEELLRARLLNRTGAGLIISSTGAGKSSFVIGAALHFAAGLDCHGLSPARALKTLLIQAENDDGDMAEFRDGALAGMVANRVAEATCNQAMQNVRTLREVTSTGVAFGSRVRAVLMELRNSDWMPDLLIIDPALSYLGGGANDDKVVTGFLRGVINPILIEFDVGAILVTHTGKPRSGRDGAIADPAYLGVGHSEWANWARFIAVLHGTKEPGLFKLKLAKRGARAQWRSPGGEPTTERYLSHNLQSGDIFWTDPTEAQLAAVQGDPGAVTGNADLTTWIPAGREILGNYPADPEGMPKMLFQEALRRCGVSVRKAHQIVDHGAATGAWLAIKQPGRTRSVLYRLPPTAPEVTS